MSCGSAAHLRAAPPAAAAPARVFPPSANKCRRGSGSGVTTRWPDGSRRGCSSPLGLRRGECGKAQSLLLELPESLSSGGQFDFADGVEVIALRREARRFLRRQKGVRKSTTTTATTDHGEAARGGEARLCGVLHIATIGQDSTRDFRPPVPYPCREKIMVSFTLTSAWCGAGLVGWPVRPDSDQYSCSLGMRSTGPTGLVRSAAH